MSQTDDQLLHHATELAEGRIRIARLHQARKTAQLFKAAFAWLLPSAENLRVCRNALAGIAKRVKDGSRVDA